MSIIRIEVPPAAPITAGDVNAERERRILAGTTVTVTGYGDVPLQGRMEDQIMLLALKDTARDLVAAGVTAAVLPFRDAVNGDHMLTADQMIEMQGIGAAWVTSVYQASWAIKAMEPIPANFTDDANWP